MTIQKVVGRVLAFLAISWITLAQATPDSVEPVTGRWIVTEDLYGTPFYMRMDVAQEGQKLAGQLDGDKGEGSFDGHAFHFVSKDARGGTETVEGTLRNGALTGTILESDEADEAHSVRHSFPRYRCTHTSALRR